MTTSSPDAARPLILIIDDESRIRRLVAANLETLGYDTAQAADGEIGFDIWKRLEPKPQLIVLDLMMPGMDGFAAVLRRTSVRASAAAGAPRAEEFVNGPLILVPEKRECRWEAAPIRLSDTEFRLLLALVKHPGAVIAHDALIREVWGAEHLGELSLLRVAFARIRRKLSEAGADGSVISSYSGVGYVITDLSESFD